MGGNATKQFGTERIDRKQYDQAIKQWLNAFSATRKESIKAIPCYEHKSDFGDIDFIVLNPNAWNLDEEKENLKSLEKFNIAIIDGIKNGNVLSLAVKFNEIPDQPIIQIDLISAKNNYEFEFAYKYYSFNDLGSLIGKIAKHFDFKFGHDGFYVIKYTNKKGKVCKKKSAVNKIEVPLNMSFEQTINFLGFNAERYKRGFETTEEIFKFIRAGEYYHQDFYLLSELNSKERRRDEKRKNIVDAEKYFIENKVEETIESIEQRFIKKLANTIKVRVHKAIKEHKSKIAVSRRINQVKIINLVKRAFNINLKEKSELLIEVTKMTREMLNTLDSRKVMSLDRNTFNKLILQQIILNFNQNFGYSIEPLKRNNLDG